MKETFLQQEGCYIEEWQNSPSFEDMSIARVRVEAKKSTALHSLVDTVERYVILSGKAEVTVGSEAYHVSEKDVIVIDKNTPQKIKNLENNDLIFLAICSPRFKIENYLSLDDK